MRVLGMGNALVDVLARLESDDSLEKMSLPKGSMQLIDEDRLIKILDEIQCYDTVLAAGGSAANAICGLSRLGISTGFIGKVNDDYYGRFYEDDLAKNGVESFLSHDTNISSGCAMAMITPDGERTFGTYLGAAATLRADDLTLGMFEGYDYFFIEGYLVQDPNLIRRAVKLAKQSGCKVVLDMASYNIVNANIDFFNELLVDTDIVFANEEESFAFTQLPPEESVRKFAEYCEIAVVKVGAMGSYVARNGVIEKVEATKASIIDSTGAGDLYAAGFLWGVISGKTMSQAGYIGSLVSGKVIETIGSKISDSVWTEILIEIGSISSPKPIA